MAGRHETTEQGAIVGITQRVGEYRPLGLVHESVALCGVGARRPERPDESFGRVQPSPQDVVEPPGLAEEPPEVMQSAARQLGAVFGLVDDVSCVARAHAQYLYVVVLAGQQLSQCEGRFVIGRKVGPQLFELRVVTERGELVDASAVEFEQVGEVRQDGIERGAKGFPELQACTQIVVRGVDIDGTECLPQVGDLAARRATEPQ